MNTLLHNVTMYDKIGQIHWLLRNRADMHVLNCVDRAPYEYCKSVDAMKLYVKYGFTDLNKLMEIACVMNNAECIEYLLFQGVVGDWKHPLVRDIMKSIIMGLPRYSKDVLKLITSALFQG